jgi:hypothetical protein
LEAASLFLLKWSRGDTEVAAVKDVAKPAITRHPQAAMVPPRQEHKLAHINEDKDGEW